jgi:DGQHR domain-containing protein
MKIDTANDHEYTSPQIYLRGQFSLWEYCIPYFSTVLPWRFAQKHLSLLQDLPGTELTDWSLAELFQRDIDWERIEHGLVKYLRNETHPQFFNSLTVALLPKDARGLSAEYREVQPPAPLSESGLESTVTSIGGVSFQGYEGTNGTVGRIRWDTSRIAAVAVDGQHRLAAIKELHGRLGENGESETQIPVLFLLPHEKAGLVEPPLKSGTAQTTSTLRRIFIDINKHAKTIQPARQIILDDYDVHSICLRSLIGERLGEVPEDEDRLPLAAVDWISESNKIDQGPFVTTVLLLKDIVSECVQSMPKFSDVQEDDSASALDSDMRSFERWLEGGFSPSEDEMLELSTHAARCLKHEVPVSFQKEHLETLRKLFENKWRSHVLRVFRELDCYSKLLEYGAENGLHEPSFVNLYAAEKVQKGRRAEARAERIKKLMLDTNPDWHRAENFTKPLLFAETEIKQRGELWAYRVVFQKALFRSLVSVLSQAPEFCEEGETDERKVAVDWWLDGVNALLETSLARTDDSFWVGIGTRPGGAVDFTASSVERISRWITAWVCLFPLAEAPTWRQLTSSEVPLHAISKNNIERRTVLAGLKRVARAQLEGKEQKDSKVLLAEAEKLRRSKYNRLRKELSELEKEEG